MIETEIFLPNQATAAPTERGAARRKARVLMVGMHLTKTRGGISTVTKEILNSSLKDDFEFQYLASQAEDFGKFGKAKLALETIFRFVGKCAGKSPDFVYVHLGSNASLYRESAFILLAKIFRLKTIAHFHAGDFDYYYARQSRAGKSFIRHAISSSDRLIAVSEDSARRLGELIGAPERVACISNGVKTSEFDFPRREKKGGVVRLLFVGAIGKLKGERDLIDALVILRRGKNFNLKVSFLGYGAENLQPLCREAGVADWIEFTGAVSLEERLKFYENADVFVLPTYGEAMSMSIIEAMAAGLPVVTTAVGGNPELIENGVNGWLVETGDAANLAEKIAFFARSESARREFGANGRRKAKEQFDISVCVEKLRKLLLDFGG
ncbi:MAG: glycosyltransferase family 4 protein [Acidobacteriota bacterium]|nr:glycosyltransferase family 4 protein [Acidobacteriota bacterium]